jgi:hypothetical protein
MQAPSEGIALIMDDVGYDMGTLQRVLKLPYSVAISVLPGSPGAKRAANMAHASGQVVMLHLPMEPANPHYRERMDDTFLRMDMNEDQVHELFVRELQGVPHVAGVNNHMGSELTTSARHMAWVMEICRNRSLFFIDSFTTKDSVAASLASRSGLAWGKRKVFLDHRPDPESLAQAWQAALRCREKHGACIVIAHPYPETLDFLEQQVSKVDQQWIRPVMDILHGGTVKVGRAP